MNIYQFNFLLEPATPPVVGDAAALTRLSKQIGYLLAAEGTQSRMTMDVVASVTAGVFVTNVNTAQAMSRLTIASRYRLPPDLEPAFPTAADTGEYVTAGFGINAVTCALDDTCGTILPTLDRPVVTAGSIIVGYIPAGASVSEQLARQVIVPACNGQRLVIGIAQMDASMGIYQTPFSAAWGYATLGGGTLQPVAVVNTGNMIGRAPSNLLIR